MSRFLHEGPTRGLPTLYRGRSRPVALPPSIGAGLRYPTAGREPCRAQASSGAVSGAATARVRHGIKAWSAEEEVFKAPIREQYEREGHPCYASARLRDDGIIDPAETRTVLALGLSAALNAPPRETRFGVFRM